MLVLNSVLMRYQVYWLIVATILVRHRLVLHKRFHFATITTAWHMRRSVHVETYACNA